MPPPTTRRTCFETAFEIWGFFQLLTSMVFKVQSSTDYFCELAFIHVASLCMFFHYFEVIFFFRFQGAEKALFLDTIK